MNSKISYKQGDLTIEVVDAIVNAANTSLRGGGGVDGAIHRKGGEDILRDCYKIIARQGGCKVGEAVITTAGRLPAKHIIHTVGPTWSGGYNNEKELLKSAYLNSLKLAVAHELKTVAFPNISTGIYKFPKRKAADIAIKTVSDFVESDEGASLESVIFVCFDEENLQIYKDAFKASSNTQQRLF
ncbi:O-acetyl-ADP-ribose deacetylase [Microscilla marina]|uniref:Appr-1-p processing n=1 Tax=Microscilla marina ATCC 23134 TaxID=313606 RepID=A1ZGG8_MICM2|nr:O-acetyl-ADP-ribose deacetylase [Microscilla marina]EAY30585.1 appr-1-p processing [Microscilla marina ATCC 23134]